VLLENVQRNFHAALSGADIAPLRAMLHKPANVEQRIGVYRNTMLGSLTEVLAAAFPVTLRIVGENFFARMAGDFVRAHPPRVPQLSVYGAALPAFIAGAAVGNRLPYLADVALLEWARNEAYFAADAEPLNPARLAAMTADDMAATRLTPHPATRVVASAFPILRIWTVNQPEVAEVPVVDMSQGETVLVTRPYMQVLMREISPHDAAFVNALAKNATLAEAAARDVFDLEQAMKGHFAGGTFVNPG